MTDNALNEVMWYRSADFTLLLWRSLGILSIREILIVKYGPVRSYNSGGRGEKNIRVRKGIPDMYVAFRFCAKLTILGATNGELCGLKSRLKYLVFGINLKGFSFCLVALWSHSYSPRLGQNFDRWIRAWSSSTSRNLFWWQTCRQLKRSFHFS